jgi:hypothetical protein
VIHLPLIRVPNLHFVHVNEGGEHYRQLAVTLSQGMQVVVDAE